MRSSLHCCGKISDQSGYTGREKESGCPLYPGYHSGSLDRFQEAFDPYHLPSLRVHNNTVSVFPVSDRISIQCCEQLVFRYCHVITPGCIRLYGLLTACRWSCVMQRLRVVLCSTKSSIPVSFSGCGGVGSMFSWTGTGRSSDDTSWFVIIMSSEARSYHSCTVLFLHSNGGISITAN